MEKFYKTITAALLAAQVVFGGGKTVAQTVTGYGQLTNIPTLYVETTSGADPADKETYLACTLKLVENGTTTTYKLTKNGIRGRGNTTWSANKKPWRLKFDKSTEFLGSDFGKGKSWTLLANAYDKSLMRNALTYHLGTFIGLEFCPAAKFVDLVMNGTYRGVYQISDQIDVRPKRVDIDEDNGWLLEYANAENKVDDPKVTLRSGDKEYGYVQIKNPEFDNDATAKWSDKDKATAAAIEAFLNDSVMAAMVQTTRSELMNPRTGYRSVTHETSLVDWYIATELTANWDGLYSIYMSRDHDTETVGPLHFGPLWDEDLAYGNNTETYSSSYFPKQDFYKKLLSENNFSSESTGGYRKMQPVINNLWNDPWFAISVKQRFDELVSAGLKDHLNSKIEEMRKELATAAAKNYERWSITEDQGYANINTNYTWTDYVDELKNFMDERIDLLATLFANRVTGITWLSEDADYDIKEDKTTHVVIKRPFVAGTWNTLCLPFALTEQDITYYFGGGSKVAEFASVKATDGGTVSLNFSSVTATEAGKPYLVNPALDVNVAFPFLNKALSAANPQTVTHDGYSFVGTYSPYEMTAGSETKLFVGTGNKLYTPNVTNKMKGFRAYFDISAVSADTKELVIDGESTGIDIPKAMAKGDGQMFNLNGQRVNADAGNLPKGVYVKGGKKVIIR